MLITWWSALWFRHSTRMWRTDRQTSRRHIYGTPSWYSRHYREERICGRRTAVNTTCHGCHLWLVQEHSPSPVHKPGINSTHLFAT